MLVCVLQCKLSLMRTVCFRNIHVGIQGTVPLLLWVGAWGGGVEGNSQATHSILDLNIVLSVCTAKTT